MLKIVLTGPESSGKTTLARDLATYFKAPWVPEYARDYLIQLGDAYQETDLLAIAKGQLAREEQVIQQKNKLIFCDTAFLVLKIWSEISYERCHPWILEQWTNRKYDLYLLCKPDFPWQYDPLREHQHGQEMLFARYQTALESQEVPFHIIEGKHDIRLKEAIEIIKRMITPLWNIE